MAGVPIDLADLQGDILRAYGNAYAHTAYVFFRIDDARRGRAPGCGGLLAARDDRRAVDRRQARRRRSTSR